ncbi:unnamed protein product [Cladocopium goreaui]|uniref:Bifunctional protein FolD 2 (Tetrahydrofolate dehydrogenase/cyclohydrolase 2) n=1 Tax=Cladocopium goreaui TaxID=2562237 RepID=A0A9P1C621_9DINO|nr:unnamed protein product [Cladocopium goreaui]
MLPLAPLSLDLGGVRPALGALGRGNLPRVEVRKDASVRGNILTAARVACLACVAVVGCWRREPGRSTRRAQIIDGKSIASQVREEVKERVHAFKQQHDVTPCLAVVLVGQRPDSQSYVRAKAKVANEVGCRIVNVDFPDSVSEAELLRKISELNAEPSVHGILVQLPLPEGINEQRVTDAIAVHKDADGLTALNLGQLSRPTGMPLAIPCTPNGCMELLKRHDVDVSGKECVILGRSAIVGMPMALLMVRANASVKVCHRYTRDLRMACSQADVLVAAVGQPEFVQGDWIKDGAVVIDVGINRVEDSSRKRGYRLAGDVHFEKAKERASLITPVPGGVGPMTVAMLLKNTITLAERSVERVFEEASAWVNKNGGDLSTSALLELYAFYKQATCGDCGGSQPMGFQAAAKWDAWSQLAGCPPDLARASYVQVLETYVPNWQFGGRVEERQSRGSGGGDVSMGPAVSTMGCIGGGDPGDVDETPAGQLCQQIAEGDVEGACGLLRASPQLAGQADKDGMLPLHWACDRGDLDMVQFLLELPAALAMINTADAAGDTALHYAVMSENESVAQLLVSKGADVTATNEALDMA